MPKYHATIITKTSNLLCKFSHTFYFGTLNMKITNRMVRYLHILAFLRSTIDFLVS